MGEVWRAYDTVTDRVVAIKVLPANMSEHEDFQRRFRREAHAAARLDTPHVVPIYDYGEIDGRLFVSMRLINGRDLDTVLTDGPLEPTRAVRIIDQVAKALYAAHRAGLLHRDIKPSNILLDGDDFAYLIDFGIARAADETRVTKSGNTIGTFAYIAPERLDSTAEEDARADIYSLACVLYEALTGEPPFAGNTTVHLIAAHLNIPPPRPSTTQPNVPSQFDEVIATGMAKDPDQRYATTIELADAARNAITVPIARPTLISTQPPTELAAPRQRSSAVGRSARRKTNRRTAIAVLAATGVVLVTAVAFAGATLRLYFADRAAEHAKREIVQTATEAMTTLWSYTPDDIEQLSDKSGNYLGGDFQDQYRKFVDALAVPNKEAQVTNETQVKGAGVEALSGSDATVLIYVNTTSTTPQTRDKPSFKYLSYRLWMRKDHSRWVITKMTTVTSMDLVPKLRGPG